MKVTQTHLPGVLVIEPVVHGDARGFFKEIFQAERYRDLGIDHAFVQDNFSRSEKNTLRGLHFQIKKPQGKLVSCSRGAVFDVAVDIDPESETFTQWVGVELSERNHKQLWIPPGYAHGFCALTDVVDFQYKCTDFYDPTDEGGIIWNDPRLEIEWPVEAPRLSGKDEAYPTLDSWLAL